MNKLSRVESEANLISYATEVNDLGFLLSMDITPDYFSRHQELAERLYEKFRRDRMVPTLKMVRKTFPQYEIPDPPEERDMLEYRKQLIDEYANDFFLDIMREVRKNHGKTDLINILDFIPEKVQTARQIISPGHSIDLIGDADIRYEKFRKRAEGEEVYGTRFAHQHLDDYLGGLRGQDLITYVSRPGIGKSFTSLLDAYASWVNGVEVLFVSLEMSAEQVGYRLDSLISSGMIVDEDEFTGTGFSNFNLQKGVAVKGDVDPSEEGQEEYREYIDDLITRRQADELPGFHIITPNTTQALITPEYIHSLAKDLNVGLVVVDYLMLVPHPDSKKDMRQRLGENSAAFKQSALQLGIPFIVPHQLNRDAEKAEEVTIANFAESDDVGRNVDIAIEVTKEESIIKYKCLKVRGGPQDRRFAWNWNYDTGRRSPVDFAFVDEDE